MAITPLTEDEVPMYTRIVADSDMDGLFGAAVLKAFRPEAEVMFTHAAALAFRTGGRPCDRGTVLVDLPFHPACGWFVDHHLTNRPNDDEASTFASAGERSTGKPRPLRLAGLRIAGGDHGHASLEPMMPVVDALDSGGISKEDFLPTARCFNCLAPARRGPRLHDAPRFLAGQWRLFEDLLADPVVETRCQQAAAERAAAQRHVEENTTVHDRLAVCRMDETSLRSNGYLVTAWVGEAADACCIVHGYADGSLSTPNVHRWGPATPIPFFQRTRALRPVRMATSLDPTGEGTPTLAAVAFNRRA